MNKIQWFFTPYKKKLEIAFDVFYENRQRLHVAGFILDFDKMKIEVDEDW